MWTADDPEDIKRMKEYGADSITTHWVTAARKICERKYLVRPGKQYKANMHCHTVISDGNYTPEEIKEIYQKEGYSVVAYTDHSRYRNHKELNDENFIAIAAYEVGLDQDSYFPTSKVLHINLYDTNPEEYAELKAESRCIPTNYEDTEGINAYLKEMTELGFLACYNHPYWSLEEEEDYLRLEHIFAMEIYNFGCEMDGMYGYNPHEYERALRNGKGWYAFSTDDNHNYHPLDAPLNDSFGGFIMIEPEEFTYAGVIKALEEGDFYSSMGPEIKEAYIEDNVLVVKTSPVKTIFAKNRTRNCYRQAAAPGETVEEARFELKGNDGYIWIEIRDEKGRYANTNAVEV